MNRDAQRSDTSGDKPGICSQVLRRDAPPNNSITLSVRVVTPCAVARVGPTRPAVYRVRSAEQERASSGGQNGF